VEGRYSPTQTASYSDVVEAPANPESYNWGAYEKYMVAFLPVHNSVDGLIDMWKSNANMLDWAKKVAPDHWQRIRDAFAKRKAAITGE
jgi:hypothetical protein